MRPDRLFEPELEHVEVGAEPRRGADFRERAHVGLPRHGARRCRRPGAARRRRRSRPLHRGGEIRGSREAAHARGKVRVRRPARQDAAEQRHDAIEPEAEERSQDAAGLGDLEAAEPPIGPEDAEELAEAVLELGHVPDPEPDRDDVEAPVLEGERGQVAVHPPDLARLRRARASISSEKSSPARRRPPHARRAPDRRSRRRRPARGHRA